MKQKNECHVSLAVWNIKYWGERIRSVYERREPIESEKAKRVWKQRLCTVYDERRKSFTIYSMKRELRLSFAINVEKRNSNVIKTRCLHMMKSKTECIGWITSTHMQTHTFARERNYSINRIIKLNKTTNKQYSCKHSYLTTREEKSRLSMNELSMFGFLTKLAFSVSKDLPMYVFFSFLVFSHLNVLFEV